MSDERGGLLIPGETCWRVGRADRALFLVDGENYFRAFRAAAKNARRSIILVGWDFDSRFQLLRGGEEDGLPLALSEFLDALARRRKDLHIHILNWDYSLIVASSREWAARLRLGWNTHKRVHFELDSHHPAGASHHQKVVVIDDRVAFVGGLDFTRGRWDTREHAPGDERRADGDEHVPRPYHDFEIMISGPLAGDVGDMARDRWRLATGKTLEPPEVPTEHDPWPDDCAPHLEDCDWGIARSLPEHGEQAEVREIERGLLAAIEAAQTTIYIENQYFTSPSVSAALSKRLAEESGPEVVVVVPRETSGWLSQYTMDILRERRIRSLREADRFDRLRVYYAHQSGLGDQCINVHSKILIVDDRILHAGSANLNNRSMALDSECNLVLDARDCAEHRSAIVALRDDLLAEHLGVSREQVAEAVESCGTVREAIGRLTGEDRTLRAMELQVTSDLDALVPHTEIADPEQPIDPEHMSERLFSEEQSKPARRGLLALAGTVIAALLLAAAWRWTPLADWVDLDALLEYAKGLRNSWTAPLIAVVVYVLGGFVMFPVTLLFVATGLAFGAVYGLAYALLGAEMSALCSYALGSYLGQDAIRNMSGRWVNRVSQALGRQGLLAVIVLRIVPVAPYTVVNLVAGASHIRLRDFAWGTLLGLLPGAVALVVLSEQVLETIRSPDPWQIALLAGLILVAGVGIWWIRRWAKSREENSPVT